MTSAECDPFIFYSKVFIAICFIVAVVLLCYSLIPNKKRDARIFELRRYDVDVIKKVIRAEFPLVYISKDLIYKVIHNTFTAIEAERLIKTNKKLKK